MLQNLSCAKLCTFFCRNTLYINVEAELSPIVALFGANDEFLVVAEYYQQKLYQLKPSTGEVRAILMQPCHPETLTFDLSINGVYMTCVEHNTRYYHIRKKTFDGRFDVAIYNAQQGKKQCHCSYRPTVAEILSPGL